MGGGPVVNEVFNFVTRRKHFAEQDDVKLDKFPEIRAGEDLCMLVRTLMCFNCVSNDVFWSIRVY